MSAVASVSLVATTLAASGVLELRVRCPAKASTSCTGSLTLSTAKGKARLLGRTGFRVARGRVAPARIALRATGRALVRRIGSLPVRLRVRTTSVGIPAAVSFRTFILHRHG